MRSRIGCIGSVCCSGFAAALLALGATAHAETQSAVPVRAANIDIARCLVIIAGTAEPDRELCPGFLLDLIAQGQQSCREAGATLTAASPANVWAVNVNGDGKRELSFEYAGNVNCEGAASLFECGSLGCPKLLYEEHGGAWRIIADDLYADSMESVEVLAPSPGQTYGTLRVGCGGETPCPEYWIYDWTGDRYERKRIEVRGFTVEFAQSVHGLYPFAGETALLATPEPDAAVIERYDSSTEIEIIGTAEGADYYYVSPCNACESGFVPKAAVRVP